MSQEHSTGKASKRIFQEEIRIIDVPKLVITHARQYQCAQRQPSNAGSHTEEQTENPPVPSLLGLDQQQDDELYKITRVLFQSKVVVFFVVRWGQANSVYQRLLERLSWIENVLPRWREALAEITKCEAGIVLFGQNGTVRMH